MDKQTTLEQFEFDGELFYFDSKNCKIYASKGEEIEYDSIESFCCDATAEGGVDNLTGWIY